MNVSFHQFILFFIIFIRVATIIATVPLFGFDAVPVQLKAGLSAMLAILVFPLVDKAGVRIPTEFLPFVLMIIHEVIIGMIIGFTANIIFVGIRFAGELIGLDMGFGIVNVIDPLSGEQVSIVGQFKYLLALLLFSFNSVIKLSGSSKTQISCNPRVVIHVVLTVIFSP